MTTPIPNRAGENVFVGRERELALLRAGLEDALAGRGRMVLLAGEPGIGKTRLAQELATTARQRGARVLFGRCYEGEGAPPFWPWVQILRAYIEECEPQTLREDMGVGAADIAQVIREVQERLPEVSASPPTLEPEQARFRLLDSVTTFLKKAARRQLLVLIFDDLQWADTLSLRLLQFVAREVSDTPLLIIGTYRDMEVNRQHPLRQMLAEVARVPGSQLLTLQALSEHEVARLLEQVTGQPAAEALVTSLYHATEGNPFFLTEMVQLFVSEGGHFAFPTSLSAAAIPQGVQTVIERRLQTLSPDCQHLLTLAAVIDREFEVRVLEAVGTDFGLTPIGERLLEVLDEAVAARIITEVPPTGGAYSFAHVLIRETVYTGLSTAHRTRLHRQIGEVLEKLYGTALESFAAASAGQALVALAHHFFQAALGGGEADKAMQYATWAGERAMAQLAYENAASYYDQALRVLDRKGEADDVRRCELLLALGEAQKKTPDSAHARDIFERAADLARRLGAHSGVQLAASFLARAALGLGREWWDGTVVVDRRLVVLLEEALRALGAEDSELRVRVLSRLAVALSFAVSSDRAAELSQQAVEIAGRINDPATLIYALSARHFVRWAPEHVEERLAMTAEIVRRAEEAGDRERGLWGRNYHIANLLELGDVTAAEKELAAFTRLATDLRHPRYLWVVEELRALWALFAGRFVEAEQRSQQALALGRRVGGQTAALLFGAKLLLLRWGQGRLHELADRGERPVFASQHPTGRSALAWFYSELGREGEARNDFTALAAHDFAELPRDVSWLLSLSFLSRACVLLGDTPSAATLYELLLPYAGRNVVVPGATFFYGCVSHSLGLLATLLARWGDAERHFTDTLTMYTKMGAKPWLAFTQHDYARMLLARGQLGDAEKAQRLLDQALATAQELGMKSLEEKIQFQVSGSKFQVPSAEARSQESESRIPTPPTLDSAPQASSSLTPDLGLRTVFSVARAPTGPWPIRVKSASLKMPGTPLPRYPIALPRPGLPCYRSGRPHE